MQRRKYQTLVACLVLVGISLPAHGQAQDAVVVDPEERAIRDAAREYLAAKQRGDVATLSTLWTPDGDYIDASGQVFKARDLFRDEAAPSRPASQPRDISLPESTIRFVTPDVAIEDGTIDWRAAGDTDVLTARFTAIWVNRNGRWLLDSLREATMATPRVNEHLKPLAWMLGEWIGTTDDSVILVSSRWSDGGNYIVREFAVQGDGRPAIAGTQRIGWDPESDQIKSWTFDSHGSSGEGHWRRDGDRWVVESTEIMADGKKLTTAAVYTPGAEGQFVWEVTSAKLADANLPPLRVEFKRAAEGE
jgi:uncharacterized protein (TIGR02246 family)